MASNKYICIHGHFYQPPRENAWLEVIEQQASAAPFHDWNERINFECYATNTTARINDSDGKILNIVNNYAKISFNFGATLLSWMEKADPVTYAAIQAADQRSAEQFSGHGSAVAQVHGHLIMPLANARDKFTQVYWGLKDFEHRFGRKAEGIWLSETACNTETLEVLAAQGVKYTILAPRQAKAARRIGTDDWQMCQNDNVNTRRPYLCRLPSGRTIALFFYDGPAAQSVAFEGILNDGKKFARRLAANFQDNDTPELMHIATDGESYGHHHRFGEMALADALQYIEQKTGAKLTNYGEYLDLFPPQYEVQIHENTSWSCAHGIERWRSNCGCNAGGGYGKWHQKWRAPLRNALNWLRDTLAPIFEQQISQYVRDPWAIRNQYIEVLLDRSEANVARFLENQAVRGLTDDEKVHLFRLLEMQRNAILMFTSCGWFFDEISSIETHQIMQYACRAIYYAKQVADVDLEEEFMFRLSQAPSNLPEVGNGAETYLKFVKTAQVDLTRVAMHYAASSLFEKYPERLDLFNYIATSAFFDRIEAGNQTLVVGKTTVRSKITHSEKHFSFAVLYLGQLNLIGNISLDMEPAAFDAMYESVIKAFKQVNLGEVIGIFQQYFGPEKFSIWELFNEEKQRIINRIMEKNLRSVENSFRKIYENNYQLMVGLQQSSVMKVPEAFNDAAQYVLNADLRRFFEQSDLDMNDLYHILEELQKWHIGITEPEAFKLAASERIFTEMQLLKLPDAPLSKVLLLVEILNILAQMKVQPNIWKSQNYYFALLQDFQNNARMYPDTAWQNAFLRLGTLLMLKPTAEKIVSA